MELNVSDDPAPAAAEHIARHLVRAIEARGRAVLALSGGSTPLPMFDHLATIDLAWASVHVLAVDERNVARDHPDSNWAEIDARLLRPTGATGHPFTVAPTAPPTVHDLLARSDAARLDDLLAASAIDVVHLGLGDDGHTASWPPGVVVPDDRTVAAIGPFNGHPRITLTPPPINGACLRVWLVTGASKRQQLAALAEATSAAPAALVRRDDTVVFADPAAGGSQPGD
ncbi:MAG: 6-phosphogluconolactonase [Acidimicrobiales bacterium]